VGDVGTVSFLPFGVVHVVLDATDGQTKKAINLTHPFGIAFGQVVVDRDHVDAAAGDRVQVSGQGRNQRFTFTSLHLGDDSAMEHHSSDQLNVEVAHAGCTAGDLAH